MYLDSVRFLEDITVFAVVTLQPDDNPKLQENTPTPSGGSAMTIPYLTCFFIFYYFIYLVFKQQQTSLI